MARAIDLTFGFRTDAAARIEAPALWGTRAIFRHGYVDILHDRQDIRSDDERARQALLEALNSGAVAAFRNHVHDSKGPLSGDPLRPTVVETHGVRFTCRAAGGYLYITAYLLEKPKVKAKRKAPQPGEEDFFEDDEALAEERGWTDDTLLILVRDWMAENAGKPGPRSLLKYLNRRAHEERMEEED